MENSEELSEFMQIQSLSYEELVRTIVMKSGLPDLSWFENWLSLENNNSIDSLRGILRMMLLDELSFAEYFENVKKQIEGAEIEQCRDFKFYKKILERAHVARYLLGDVYNFPLVSMYFQKFLDAYPNFMEEAENEKKLYN